MAERQAAVRPPVLAVVGHPNKGKSSLVATLARDDSVGIAAHPGTTLAARAYPMRLDGELLYTLIDTPGFQRARAVLAELSARSEARGASAADRASLVAEFVADPASRRRFPDECELLAPIVEGAGILYVVDGGVPYGPEYEAEMEILRWTGAPSMAIVNPIVHADHVDAWRAALGQFFRLVRVVDAVRADFTKRRDLLLAFGQLEHDWRAPIERAVAALDADRAARRRQSAHEIAELLAEALGFVAERRLGRDEDPDGHREPLEAEYKAQLVRLEQQHRKRIQQLYDHHGLEAEAPSLEILEEDLFSEDTWLTFGLRRRDLVAAGAASGAATGAFVDAALHGASLFLGAATGAAIGGVLGWFGAGRLAELKVVNQPLGGRLARFGPSRNPNFPYVLLGRARYHWQCVSTRTHAMRTPLVLGGDAAASLPLSAERRKALDRCFRTLRKPGLSSSTRYDAEAKLRTELEPLLEEDEARA